MLLAWTAAYAIVICAALALGLTLLRFGTVSLATGRTRIVLDVLFALLGLWLLWLLF
jgi:hypothetical protein